MGHKHTPGPWSLFEAEGGGSFIDHIDSDYVAHRVAFVYSDDAIDRVVTERNRADARLIAAAPDLLSVAQWARDAMRQAFDEVLQTIPEGGAVPPWMATLETTIADAEQVISKATKEPA